MSRPFRILLVEDEALLSLSLKMELRREGYLITDSVTTGEDALESIREDPPDLVLMDIRLGGELDGVDTARAVRASTGIPVLFMTGYDDEKTRSRAQAVEPLGFLSKPFRFDQLRPLLEARFGTPTPPSPPHPTDV